MKYRVEKWPFNNIEMSCSLERGDEIKVSVFLNVHVNQESAAIIKYLHGKL